MTKFFAIFEKRIDEIKKGLNLNSPFLLEKADEYQEYTKAFILLIHAELEKYFETISLQIVLDGQSAYRENGKINKPLLSLLSSNIYQCKVPKRFSDEENKQDEKLEDRISHFVNEYVTLLKNNNGIRGRCIFKMLWTIGFSKEEVGEKLLELLDKYGRKRGKVAHQGSFGTETSLNYEYEIREVENIKNELRSFDSLIDSNRYLDERTKTSYVEAILYKKDDEEVCESK